MSQEYSPVFKLNPCCCGIYHRSLLPQPPRLLLKVVWSSDPTPSLWNDVNCVYFCFLNNRCGGNDSTPVSWLVWLFRRRDNRTGTKLLQACPLLVTVLSVQLLLQPPRLLFKVVWSSDPKLSLWNDVNCVSACFLNSRCRGDNGDHTNSSPASRLVWLFRRRDNRTWAKLLQTCPPPVTDLPVPHAATAAAIRWSRLLVLSTFSWALLCQTTGCKGPSSSD